MYRSLRLSLILTGIVLFVINQSFALHHNHHNLGHWKHIAREQAFPTSGLNPTVPATPCSGADCIDAAPLVDSAPCTSINGSTITAGSNNGTWTVLCDIDFFAQDIFPFIMVNSFEDCLERCEDYSDKHGKAACAGFVFAPGRVHLENDCYLKSSVQNMTYPSTIHLVGATLVPVAPAISVTATAALSSSTTAAPKLGIYKPPNTVTQASAPRVVDVAALGTSSNKPTKQYVQHQPASPIKLTTDLLQAGINLDLVTKYPLAGDTGSWTSQSTQFELQLANMTVTPRLSRDGGKGGSVNGTHIFVFCDTSTFGETETAMGLMNGFVSSSAAVDLNRNAANDEALILENPIGQWQDDVGRLRGWIPLTTGEEAFNIAISGDGYRYAVWPESSLIPLNESHSLIYAALVYVQVDMATQNANFTSLGNSLIAVSYDPVFGPRADRIVNQLFTADEVEWGTLGGFRAWGTSGNTTMDGSVFVFGQVDGGVLVAKVPPSQIMDRSAYTYWNGTGWSPKMEDRGSTAYLIEQPVMDFDIFWSPYHQCFFMVYLTPFADNIFWMRYTNTLSSEVRLPAYVDGGSEDWSESIVMANWSEPMVLYKPDPPKTGYIYAGGVHAGYFGADDITMGGHKLLFTWTEHTERDPNDPSSGYAHKAAVANLG